ncbi:hypothetical protein BaRGS_00007253, partial [Batillaria attramentaria]
RWTPTRSCLGVTFQISVNDPLEELNQERREADRVSEGPSLRSKDRLPFLGRDETSRTEGPAKACSERKTVVTTLGSMFYCLSVVGEGGGGGRRDSWEDVGDNLLERLVPQLYIMTWGFVVGQVVDSAGAVG